MSSPAGDVMEILGHSQITLTMNTYSHVAPEVSWEAADRMARALWHDEDQRMTTVAARVAARPVTGTPKPQGTGCGRVLPRSTGTSEQTRSKRGNLKV